jgi:hypothetical protein
MFPLHDFKSQNRVMETRFQSGILKKKKKKIQLRSHVP